jgi:alkylhydroperoxidase family enzyme
MSTTPRLPSALEGEAATFHNLLAHEPGAALAFRKLYGTMWSHGIVSQTIKETVRLRNARVTDCGLCRQVRFSAARDEGLTEDIAMMIDDDYETADLTEQQKVALRYADVYLKDPSKIDAKVRSDMAAHFTSAEIVEITLALAMFLGMAKVLISLGTEPVGMPVTVFPTPDYAVAAVG